MELNDVFKNFNLPRNLFLRCICHTRMKYVGVGLGGYVRNLRLNSVWA